MAEIDAHLDGAPLSLFVYDLSMDGCMIETDDPRIVEDTVLDLAFDERTAVGATVIWRKNRNAGLKFLDRLRSPVVAALIERNGNEGEYGAIALTRAVRLKSSRSARQVWPPAP